MTGPLSPDSPPRYGTPEHDEWRAARRQERRTRLLEAAGLSFEAVDGDARRFVEWMSQWPGETDLACAFIAAALEAAADVLAREPQSEGADHG